MYGHHGSDRDIWKSILWVRKPTGTVRAATATAIHSTANPTTTYTVSVRRATGTEKTATTDGSDPVNCRCTIWPRLFTYIHTGS